MGAPIGNQFALGNNGGQPTKYPKDDERRKLFEQIIALASEGKSITQISARLDIPRGTLWSWGEQHDEFSALLRRAKELEQAWWEEKAQGNLENRDFNANLWNKSMASRFRSDYGDRVVAEHTGKDGAPLIKSADPTEIANAVIGLLGGTNSKNDDREPTD